MSIVVYPPGYDTLPVRILTLMANGAPSLYRGSVHDPHRNHDRPAGCRRPLV